MWIDLDFKTDCLFLDIDGTLLDYAPTADTVIVPKDLVSDLEALRDNLSGALALVTGRSLPSVDSIFPEGSFYVSGNHGRVFRKRTSKEIESAPPLPSSLRTNLKNLAASYQDLYSEDKDSTFFIDYKKNKEVADEIKKNIQELIQQEEETYSLLDVLMGYEILRPNINKGTAIYHFMDMPLFAGKRPHFIGDDVTDLAGIEAAESLGGHGALVHREPPLERAPTFSTPQEVRDWIKVQNLK